MGNGGFIMKKQKLIMHTVPTTNVRHFFVTYLFILKDKFQKFQIQIFSSWRIGLLLHICNSNPMVFNIQQFWQISVKLSLFSTIAFPNYFVPYISSKNGIIF
jgi:hypothetical protein